MMPPGYLSALIGRAESWVDKRHYRRLRGKPTLDYTAAVTSKPRRGLAFVATLCLVAILAAAMVPAADDAIHGVLDSVTCLPDAPAGVRVRFVARIEDPRDAVLPRCVPARGPPLV